MPSHHGCFRLSFLLLFILLGFTYSPFILEFFTLELGFLHRRFAFELAIHLTFLIELFMFRLIPFVIDLPESQLQPTNKRFGNATRHTTTANRRTFLTRFMYAILVGIFQLTSSIHILKKAYNRRVGSVFPFIFCYNPRWSFS